MKNQLYKTMAGIAELARKLDTSSDLDVYLNLYPQESIQKRKFFNVGAGQFYHPCWTNVDDGSSYYENINGRSPNRIRHNLFLKTPLPVGDADAEIIYTSHTLEHIDNESVRYFLKDSHRMLKDEGVLRIVVPDIELSYRAWQKNDRHYFFWIDRENFNKDYLKQGINMPLRQASLTQIFLEDFAAAVSEITLDGAQKRISDAEMREIFNSLPFEQALDYCTSGCTIEAQIRYPFRHMNWFNETKLKLLLQEAGFEKIHRCGYLQSSAPVLRNSKYFDSSMPQISLYMEAVK